jgi:hypothetical protein
VIGIDPAGDMLAKAIRNPQVEYHSYDGRVLDFENDKFDIITFAGSLYYAKSQELLNEVVRVSKKSAEIIVYDFEILLDQTLADLNIIPDSKGEVGYNHQEDFSGLDIENIQIENTGKDSITIKISAAELAHLLLSSKTNYNLLSQKYGHKGLYDRVVTDLSRNLGGNNHHLKANIFYSVYQCS